MVDGYRHFPYHERHLGRDEPNMARLVVNPGSPTSWEIELKPGANTIGRGFANDFKIPDPSVSGSHCQITLGNGNAILRDLGSTNGTFVNRSKISETPLQPGQTIHLGGVELLFQADERLPALALEQTPPLPPALPLPAPPSAAPAVFAGSHNCKFHPKTAARYLCNQCQLA